MAIRRPVWAGQFYPASPAELKRMVEEYTATAEIETPHGELLGLMVPHAGYLYSGAVAGYAYHYLREAGRDFETVVLIGSAHHALVNGVAVYAEGSFSSPLGAVEVDQEATKELLQAAGTVAGTEPHQQEHSLEVQLPFLQCVLKGFRIVPLLLGSNISETNEKELTDALLRIGKKRKTLLLASSDMSHYPDQGTATKVDRRTLEAICSLDLNVLASSLDASMAAGSVGLDTALCGEEAVRLMLSACLAQGANKGITLRYANSGDTSGDKDRVVGYGAVALVKED